MQLDNVGQDLDPQQCQTITNARLEEIYTPGRKPTLRQFRTVKNTGKTFKRYSRKASKISPRDGQWEEKYPKTFKDV